MLPFLTPEPTPILLQKATNLTPFLSSLRPYSQRRCYTRTFSQTLHPDSYILQTYAYSGSYLQLLIFDFDCLEEVEKTHIFRKPRPDGHSNTPPTISTMFQFSFLLLRQKSLSLRYTRYIDLLRTIVIRQVLATFLDVVILFDYYD